MADGRLSHPTPPQAKGDLTDHLRLIRSRRVGPVTYHRLLAEHGTAAAALAALPGIAAAAGVTDYEPCPIGVVQAELAAGARAGARPLLHHDPAYPALLADLADAPPLLWCLGDPGLLARPLVAVVGARNASALGIRMARRMAADLGAAGFAVVSGLARGIDGEAHMAALDTGTIAVQAGGVDVIYPEENAGLAADIARLGLRLSEQPPGLQPQARHFPLRNRIIAGLSQAVLVIEAAAKSGSLITAQAALDQGREVLAVPGHPFDARAGGCNLLIRDGATLVRGADDVLAVLRPGLARAATAPHSTRTGAEGRAGAGAARADAAPPRADPPPVPEVADRRAPSAAAPPAPSAPMPAPQGAAYDGQAGIVSPRATPPHIRPAPDALPGAVSPAPIAAGAGHITPGLSGVPAASQNAAGPAAAPYDCPEVARDGTPDRAASASADTNPHAANPPDAAPHDPPARPRPDLKAVARLHGQILDRLGPAPLAEDQLIRDLSLPAADLAPELLALELEGQILRQPGGLLSRV